MNSKCNVVKFSLAYSAELGQGSAWVKTASLGVFKMALRQAGYTAWTASSSLDDKSCHNLKGDLLFHSSSAGVFLTRIAIYHAGTRLCR